MHVINQDNLIRKIEACTIDTLPQTIMLEGPYGAGKHTLFNLIKERLSIESLDITGNISDETLDMISLSAEQLLVLIDGQKLTEREQNIILKFIEEPMSVVHIVILCENINRMLPTIVNRCQVWRLNTYTKNQLREFTSDEIVLELARTPGEAIHMEALKDQIPNMINTCNAIFDKMGHASFSNVLKLVDYLALDGEQDKYDVSIFFRVLLYVNKKKIIESPNLKMQQAYLLTDDLCNGLQIPNINIQSIFENYLVKIKMLLAEN